MNEWANERINDQRTNERRKERVSGVEWRVWSVECGEWRVESGEWRVESGVNECVGE